MRRRSNAHFIVAAACFCFVYVFGVSNLKSDPVTAFSEWNSLRHISLTRSGPANSIADVLASIERYSSDHGPLYFVILRYWRDLVGGDLATYRLLSVFFGLFTLAFAYRLALITGNSDTALAATLIAAFLAFLVYFSHEARMYSLLPMLAALVAWLYWKIISTPGRVRWWLWASLTLSAAAIVYVHYFGIFVLAAIGLYHLLLVPKNGRWFGVCLAMSAAGLLFTPWLPVALKGLNTRDVPTTDSLSLVDSVLAISGIYSNGMPLIVPVVIALLAMKFDRVGKPHKYILFLTLTTFALMIAANEIAPLIIARRIRYTVILAVPWACTLAIGLNMLPKRHLIRIPFALFWIAACIGYTASEDLALYTNELTTMTEDVPHFEDFVYSTDWTPRPNESIISFHPFARLRTKIRQFYTGNLPQWRDIIHLYYGDDGELTVESWNLKDITLDDLDAEQGAFWVIHNPLRVDLSALPVYSDWFRARYRPCRRYLELDDNIIDYYVHNSLPCELLLADQPFTISYDNGAKLENLVAEQNEDELNVYFWWQRTIYSVYSLTLQVFNSVGEKVLQIDDVIAAAGADIETLNVASLAPGDYSVRLIMYDFESKQSQPGTVVNSGHHFEREVEIARFSI